MPFNGGGKASRICPRCNSERVWRDGRRNTRLGVKQRFLCRDCGLRFDGEIIISASLEIVSERQVCATRQRAKNLIVAKEEKLATGEISETEKLLTEFIFYLRKRGNKNVTIERRLRYLKELAKKRS